MKIVILPSARDDLSVGFEFYERQDRGLGDYFLDSLLSDIDSLKLFAGRHRRIFGVHRLLSQRFPYGIYYGINAETVYVKAVLDCRQDPAWIRKKLK